MNSIYLSVQPDSRIQRHKNGIQLINGKKVDYPCVKDIFDLPLQMYFYDLNHAFCYVNKTTAKVNGFISEIDAIGKTIFDSVSRDSANRLASNNQKILNQQSMHIFEESILRKDDVFMEGISFKFPWYREEKLVGLFGCSFVIDSAQTLARNLFLLTQTGLLHFPKSMDKYYFSKREKDILSHLTRGKSAREIASALNLSKRTVEHYIENIKFKTQSSRKSELIEKVYGMF